MNAKKLFSYLLLLIFLIWLGHRVLTGSTPLSLDKNVLGIWLSAFFTLCAFSFLYKDNFFYRLAENIFVGVSAAYWMIMGFWSTIMANCLPKVMPSTIKKVLPGVSGEANYLYIISLVLGLFLLTRLTKKFSNWSRLSLAFVVGYAAGMNLMGYLVSDFTTQIKSSIVPLVIMNDGALNWGATFSAIMLMTGTIACLCYFFFSKEHKGLFGKVSRYGIWILMVSFGASFAYTVMGRIAILIGRMQFLFKDWLHLIN